MADTVTGMAYDVPGRADKVGEALRERWNEAILAVHDSLTQPPPPNIFDLRTRFFEIDPAALTDPETTTVVKWAGDPLEPTFCTDIATVRTLSDWGSRGRHALQNEYCEYAVTRVLDSEGRLRPKRVQVTTELREYWLTLATYSPTQLLTAATDVLDSAPTWRQLYGVDDPKPLTEDERRLRFAVTMAGHGGDPRLIKAGVPANPVGRLNTENAVFMTHPINGLDDLIFIVLFGARRFAVRKADGTFREAAPEDIFADRAELFCRHADPAAALAAYTQVLAGKAVGFANPLGMYLRPFALEPFQFQGETIPEHWVRWRRGKEGMFQRLEFGPSDEDDAFLDEIEVAVGQDRQPLSGGHQLVRQLEVGPLVAVGPTAPANEADFVLVPEGQPIDCEATGICTMVRALKREHDEAMQPKVAPRQPPGP